MAEQLQNSSEPQLCRNCHDFFGSVQTNFLCSKCFEKSKASAPLARPEAQPPQSPVQAPMLLEEVKAPAPSDVSRCFRCKRKVGLTKFVCKCGETFCTNCRQPEVHLCGFDHRAQGVRKLSESNPLVVAEKVSKI